MTALLDVNALMALLWENHEHHGRARRWLATVDGFATCPLTQLGFARISSHPMLGFAISPEQAFSVLRRLIADPRHRFVPDSLSVADRVFFSENIASSNDVTDHYLASLAREHGMLLATFDTHLARGFASEPGLVFLLP